jgi:selenocysteine-specific elongation factor
VAIPAAVPVDTARDMRVIATAGHVDHGKSSLVLALTGTDPDRFEEEKRRGLTIDLGFAHAALPSGAGISIVDVPGHVRFLRNMLAGVGGVDATLFVVAATEGWKPQSEEHLRILELLGVRHGIVALTKVDLVDDEWAQLAALDVADHVAGTFLDGAAIVPVASTDGRGLDELRHELDRLVMATPAAIDRGRPRLWVDRAFAARGSGTVVTGTLTGGTLAAGDAVVVEPGGRPARIRSIQTLGHGVTSIGPGRRTALNLAGIGHDDIARGDAVVTPGRWATTTRVDAHLDVLASLDHEVSRRGAYVAYVGSREVPARLRVLGSSAVLPGAGAPVRLFLADALPLLPGDRFVLRESGRDETVGGGEVLDIAPVRPASKASPDRSIERVVRERGWVTVDDLELLTGERVAPTVGRWVVTPDALETAAADVRSRVAGAGPAGLDVATLDDRERALLDELDDRNEVTVDAGRARTAGTADPYDDHPFVRAVRDGWFSPPDADASSVARNDVRELVRRGHLLERDGVVFHRDAVDAAAQVAARLLADRPHGYTMGEFRDALGTTRKHALPLAALLDAGGVTRRRDDVRIAGPRLPAA